MNSLKLQDTKHKNLLFLYTSNKITQREIKNPIHSCTKKNKKPGIKLTKAIKDSDNSDINERN